MRISNLRIERRDGHSYLTVDINTKIYPPNTINYGSQCLLNMRIG